MGKLDQSPTIFEPCKSVSQGGLMFSIPSLIATGLLKGMSVYQPLRAGYYGLLHILLLLGYMALGRVKNPEGLKQCAPGELGKSLGLDRVPEAKCLRGKLQEIFGQKQAETFGRELSREWMKEQEGNFLVYIDGHVRVYSGEKANLPKKHVAGLKLCKAGTTEYWANSPSGDPYMVVTEELNYKIKAAIEDQIIPRLLEDIRKRTDESKLAEDAKLPRLTIVFDREASEPSFFGRLWSKYRIAVITYRKNVKDKLDEELFQKIEYEVLGKKLSMNLYERLITISEVEMREIRKLGDSGHQTVIVTTNRKMSAIEIARGMFARWTQENFFKYAISDYYIDRLIEYGTEEIDPEKLVVNSIYNKLTYKIKKLRESLTRVEAKLFKIVEQNLDKNIDRVQDSLQAAGDLQQRKQEIQAEISLKLEERANHQPRIKLAEMALDKRYNKLKPESKLFMNTIKMIAYRAETAMANLISPHYARANEEARMLIKEIMGCRADIIPDYQKNTLTVSLHTLSTPRANLAAAELAKILNDSETIYPGTDLVLIYKTC